MILPIFVYGCPVLRQVAKNVEKDMEGFETFLANMWETMYATDGVGLAAPQVGKSLRLFVLDGNPFKEDDASLEGFKKVFINPQIIKLEGEPFLFNEGCLSVPGIREDVFRPESVTIQYLDEKFEMHTETFTGIAGRIIQHEYDHLEGKLLIDYTTPLRKRLLKRKLSDISTGKAKYAYRVKLPV